MILQNSRHKQTLCHQSPITHPRLSTIHNHQSSINHPPSSIIHNHQSSINHPPPSIIHSPQSSINHPPSSTITNHLSIIHHHPSSTITNHPSILHPSSIIHHFFNEVMWEAAFSAAALGLCGTLARERDVSERGEEARATIRGRPGRSHRPSAVASLQLSG